MNGFEAIGLFVVGAGCTALISGFVGACLWATFSNMDEDSGLWFWAWVVSLVVYGVMLVVFGCS